MPRHYSLQSRSDRPSSGIDYAAELNAEQLAAVSSPPGAALVIAGAGSGKTRVLTYRLSFLLDQGVDPRNILLLTFTNKAAQEMKERAHQLVKRDLSTLWSGTFHSIGNRFLRRHADEFGLTSSFSIFDRDDQKSFLKDLLKQEKFETKQDGFPKADILLTLFSLHQNTSTPLQDILSERYHYLEEWGELIQEVFSLYQQKKRAANSVDFDDLLTLPLQLFQKDSDLLALYQKRFQFILVDEYQDTNVVQSDFIDLLAGRHKSLMVVGDDAQSIYSWRGANMEHILQFPQRYPQASIYKIETNYRSVPQVLSLSNAIIQANSQQFTKTLRAHRPEASDLPALIPLETPSHQARFITQRILEIQDKGIRPDEIAILYRAHHQSLEIQLELTSQGIPFQITSGLRFFEQAHLKDVLSVLRFSLNPKDEVAFKRFCLLLPGIGPASAHKLWQQWLQSPYPQQGIFPQQVSDLLRSFSVPKKALPHWEQVAYTLDEITSSSPVLRPSEMIFSLLEGFYDDYLRQHFDNYEQRRQDLDSFSTYSESFESLNDLLQELSLLTQLEDQPSSSSHSHEQVTLSSIHQSKGLEWKAVFIIWLAEGAFPNSRILESPDPQQLEEERRLFYVAVTRAQDELYLTYPMINPKSYTGETILSPSRFLGDFPSECVEPWQIQSSPWSSFS